VLVEGPSKRAADELFTRTDGFRPVIIPAVAGVGPGALLDVVIERTTAATLFGRPTGKAAT
jgi:tRNA A37 methylthiotransferase MiaB